MPFRFSRLFPVHIMFTVLVMVFMFSVVLAVPSAHALTDREERLLDLCKTYEEWFSSHARNYNMSLPLGAAHVKFECYRTPQTINQLGNLILSEPLQMIASVLIENNVNTDINGCVALGSTPSIIFHPSDFDFARFVSINRSGAEKEVYVSSTPPDAGTLRSSVSSVWDFFSSAVNVDQGAYVVFMRASIFVDCTECANILAKFPNEAFQIVK